MLGFKSLTNLDILTIVIEPYLNYLRPMERCLRVLNSQSCTTRMRSRETAVKSTSPTVTKSTVMSEKTRCTTRTPERVKMRRTSMIQIHLCSSWT